MDASTRAPGYDLFKLIVAILLLILALFLMWISPPQTFAPLPATSSPLIASPTTAPISPTLSPATAETEASEPTWTPLPLPTATRTLEGTATPPPPPATEELSPTPILAPTATPPPAATAEPSPTPPPGPIATPITGMPPANACETAVSRSRLRVGMNVTILRRLNFRSSPGIRDNWLLTNIPGTQVQVVGGPECVPYWTGAYLWWQIQLPDGRVGWSAEGSLHGTFYFMEPG